MHSGCTTARRLRLAVNMMAWIRVQLEMSQTKMISPKHAWLSHLRRRNAFLHLFLTYLAEELESVWIRTCAKYQAKLRPIHMSRNFGSYR